MATGLSNKKDQAMPDLFSFPLLYALTLKVIACIVLACCIHFCIFFYKAYRCI